MTKSYKIFEAKRILGIILLLLVYLVSNAQEQIAESKQTHMFKDANIGYLIIGGILGFGITGYIIVSIIEKYRKKSDAKSEKTVNHGYSRYHHHKIIKKSP